MANPKDVSAALAETGKCKAAINTLNSLLSSESIKQRFNEVLGKKGAAFMSSVLAATNINPSLKACEPMSVISSAMVAATLDLPINQSLGFAHLVPYGNKCQFQIGWRGLIQLGQRTGLYRTINAGLLYKGQIKSNDLLTGKIEVDEEAKETDDVIGYFAHFELLNGFQKTVYMTKAQAEKHGKRYSKSYATGQWTKDFDSMATKTVIKNLFGKWAPLSTDYQMQKALQMDQAIIKEDGTPEYIDNGEAIDAETVVDPEKQKLMDSFGAEKK